MAVDREEAEAESTFRMVLSIALSEGWATEEGTREQVCIRGMYGGMKMRGVRCVCVLVREPRGYIGRCA